MAARDQARRLPHQGNFTWTSCERLPARFPDPHARNVGLSTAGDQALALRGRESGLEQVEQHVDREAVFRTAQVEWHLAILAQAATALFACDYCTFCRSIDRHAD